MATRCPAPHHDFILTCERGAPGRPRQSTIFALQQGARSITLVDQVVIDGWWANVDVVGDDAFFTFRFHKLD